MPMQLQWPHWETFGIDCSVCHNAVLTTDTAGAQVVVARDFVVRTARDANQPNDAHSIQYSLLNDSTQLGSVRLCATCHKSMYSTTVAGTFSGMALKHIRQAWSR